MQFELHFHMNQPSEIHLEISKQIPLHDKLQLKKKTGQKAKQLEFWARYDMFVSWLGFYL